MLNSAKTIVRATVLVAAAATGLSGCIKLPVLKAEPPSLQAPKAVKPIVGPVGVSPVEVLPPVKKRGIPEPDDDPSGPDSWT